jgi:hypothetical protein
MSRANLTILLSGMLAGDPGQGGATWAVLQYALGLRRLGHDVYIVEPVAPDSPTRSSSSGYFTEVIEAFGFVHDAALVYEGTRETVGMPYEELRLVASRADLLININGILREQELLEALAVRVYMDIDAGFNQLWHSAGFDRRFDGHTSHATIGPGIGESWSPVPSCGIEWFKTVQPVVLEYWPVAGDIVHDALTTVGNWRSSGSFEYEGVFIGQKAHSLRPLIGLPQRTSERLVLALGIHPDETKDLEALKANGWELLDAATVAATPDTYRSFVQGSKAEFGLVQQGCSTMPCGWFSDRSACYLASGRPVVAQETGFSHWLPAGEGVFAFSTEDQALEAIEELSSDYPRHSRAARALAEEYFDSDKVLTRLLEGVVG